MMTSHSTTMRSAVLVLAAVLAVILTASAEAAQARKHKKRVTAGAAVSPHYWGANLYPAGPVYNGQDYLGDDPDPFIRLQIMRDNARYGGPE